ncbi:MAG: hypothetical protein ACXACH_07250 [Candidatus Hermodarchaeia archaeon]|jgi:hypothetical protein
MPQANDLAISRSLRDLLTYVCSLEEHMNQMDQRLDAVDAVIRDLSTDIELTFESNNQRLATLQETILTKSELNTLLHQLNAPFDEFSRRRASESPRKRSWIAQFFS